MPYVQDFSSHVFDRIELAAPTVGELIAEVDAHPGSAVVATVSSVRRSFLVHRGHLEHLLEVTQLSSDARIVASGLLDALALGQLNVEVGASPMTVTRLLHETQGALAVVLRGHDPVGVFDPSVLAESIPNASILRELPHGEDVASLARQNRVLEALQLAENSFSTFHSEGINAVGPRPLQCQADRGHYVGRCPCPRPGHSGAPCSRSR
jgi:hypothetical protein